MNRLFLAAVLAVLLGTGCAHHQHHAQHAQYHHGKAGASAAGLARLERVIAADVEAGKIPGAVMMVQRDGKLVYSRALGRQDATSGAPMREDSIFRIYSMTKPIVSIGIMMLVEEGRINLTDPVSKFIPELKGVQVGLDKGGKLEMVAAQRDPSIQDLLRHTSGYTYGVFGKGLVKDLYTKNGVDRSDHTNAEFVKKLSTVPLMYQPGTVWEYGRSTDVLGHVIERVSGQPLDQFLQARILGPLGMKDTAFWVEPSKQARIAEPFPKDPVSGAAQNLLPVKSPPKYLSGGGGMVSTAQDYVRFAQMLLNYGELGGVRIVSRKTVEYMTSDHLGTIRGPAAGYGFGLGFAVRMSDGVSPVPGSAGDYNWGGFGGTYFWVDPKERLVAVWMMQAVGPRTYYRELYRNLVYSALE
jgi:CubicO group peptidase (beta-lactamase class C family)